MNKPKDMKLYNAVKARIYKRMTTHSAYRSGLVVKEYKKVYKKKYGNSNSYVGKKDKTGLVRWFGERWRNQRGGVGYKKKGDVYRPTKKISKKTPLTYNELSKTDIKKASLEKKRTGRVKKYGN